MTTNVIILGCGRSGTSIFGELFEGFAVYRYLFEPRLQDFAAVDFGAGPVAVKVPKAELGTPMTAGLPFLIADLFNIVPEPRTVFWQVRNPLDTVCSLQPGIESNWSHNPRPPDWEEWLHRPLVERCARHWSYINLFGYRAVKDFAVISRYEDLVCSPREVAERSCRAAGLDPANHRDDIAEWASKVCNAKGEDTYEAKGQVRWSRQDHRVRVGRWRENLSSKEIDAILPIVAPAAERLGYDNVDL